MPDPMHELMSQLQAQVDATTGEPGRVRVAPEQEDENEILLYLGTCQSCGRYLDVRRHKRCPSPCDGYIG